MEFRIADTFTDSLSRLTAQEQKAVKTTAFDLQLDASAPGLSFHKLDRAKDPNFWSVRVNADIRLIVHRTAGSLLLAYVGHHDDAYKWAERRRIERHPATGAMQLVEMRERVEETAVHRVAADVPAARYLPPLFLNLLEDEILGVGVPPEWVNDVRNASEDNFFDIAEHLPGEAAEALLDYVTTGVLRPAAVAPDGDPFAHPDAERRFRVMENVEELERALDFPWEKWTIFLHPAQRRFVEASPSGPMRIGGSAGTGKTVVALHRAAHLARETGARPILLTTFSRPLAHALGIKLDRLLQGEGDARRRVLVEDVRALGHRLHAELFGQPNIASPVQQRTVLRELANGLDNPRFTPAFLWKEWREVVDAWQIETREDYAQVPRLGRRTRLGETQRAQLWEVFAEARRRLAARGVVTWSQLFGRVSAHYGDASSPCDAVLVDEAQDMGVPEIRLFASLGRGRPDGLFFAGDLGQRIFQAPFSWMSLGVDVRGRSHSLKVNYRTSHQIRASADRLLPRAIADVDGIEEERGRTVSVFNGPPPVVEVFDNARDETGHVAGWILELIEDGLEPQEIGIFVRSERQLSRARQAAKATGLQWIELSERIEAADGRLVIGTMHLAKGLEFRAVAVIACDDEVIPLQERIETVADESDLEEVYTTERHLLYVACTRAREHLLVTGVRPESEFLGDLGWPGKAGQS